MEENKTKTSTQAKASVPSMLPFAHTACCFCMHLLAMVRYKSTVPLSTSQSLHSQGHLEYACKKNVRGRIKETRRKETCFHKFRLLSNQTEVQFLEKDERLSQFKPTGNPSILLSHPVLQLQKGGSRMKEPKLDLG